MGGVMHAEARGGTPARARCSRAPTRQAQQRCTRQRCAGVVCALLYGPAHLEAAVHLAHHVCKAQRDHGPPHQIQVRDLWRAWWDAVWLGEGGRHVPAGLACVGTAGLAEAAHPNPDLPAYPTPAHTLVSCCGSAAMGTSHVTCGSRAPSGSTTCGGWQPGGQSGGARSRGGGMRAPRLPSSLACALAGCAGAAAGLVARRPPTATHCGYPSLSALHPPTHLHHQLIHRQVSNGGAQRGHKPHAPGGRVLLGGWADGWVGGARDSAARQWKGGWAGGWVGGARAPHKAAGATRGGRRAV